MTSEHPRFPEHARPHSPPVRAGRGLLRFLQRALYSRVFSVSVEGVEHVPARGGLVIAANHTSHLDMGLIKHALGPAGEDLVSLAAADYFFENPLLRWYFGNFTNLMPFDRRANLKSSLRAAGRALEGGRNLLLFPEGTRTRDGRMGSFKPTLGYLALNFEAPVLPVHLSGAFEALPRGAALPRRRHLKVAFGPAIEASELRRATSHLRDADAYRAATEIVENAVRRLGGEPARAR